MSKKVIIKCDQNGGIHVDAEGFHGVSCAESTKVFLNAYQGDQDENKKPEYYAEQEVGQTVDAGIGRM